MIRVTPRTHRIRLTAVTLLVAAGSVNYFDRAAVSVGNPEIRHDLALSYSQMGLLLSAFALAYGFSQIPAGIMIGKFGPRRTLGIGLVLWSFAQLSAGLVRSLPQFIAARAALGLGESPMYIGGTRVCADWYPLKDRALPIAIFNSSSALAPAIAPPLLTWLMIVFGWRAMFVIAGLLGFLIALLWVALYRSPEEAQIPRADAAAIHQDDIASFTRLGWRQVLWILRFQTAWGMFLGFFGVVYVSWLYATWLPGYLETARNLDVANAGLWSAVPLGGGFAGAVAGGFISARLGRIGISAPAACRWPVIWGLVTAGVFTIAGTYVANTTLAIAFMACGLFAANVSSSCGWALAAVVIPVKGVATLEAIQNVGGSLGGAFAPFITGVIVSRTGSFSAAFLLAAVIAFVCAGAYWAMTRRSISESE